MGDTIEESRCFIMATKEEKFLKDMMNEDAFRGQLEVEEIKGIEKEVDLMKKVYNEQAENLARWRFDVDFWSQKIEQEPYEKEHKVKLEDAKMRVANLRITLRVIREHILRKYGKSGQAKAEN